MYITSQYSRIDFGTTYRKVMKEDKPYLLDHESSTHFFVNGLQWNKFFNHVIKKYENEDKVNVFSLACSDGSEAYSIAMLLMAKLGDKAEKYFPITAVDFDDEVMNLARSGFMDLSADDELRINKYTGNKLNKFFERTNYSFMSDKIGGSDRRELLTRFKIKDELRNKVNFITENVNTYIDSMPEKNNLIFFRNCWPYLYKSEQEIAKKISEKADEKSFLVVGYYDEMFCPMTRKNCYGFSMSRDFVNVFDKSGSDYFDQDRWFSKSDFKDE